MNAFTIQKEAGPYYGLIAPTAGGGSDTSSPGNEGRAVDWILENGDEAVDVLNSVLCMVNPRRPGCPGDPATRPQVIQTGLPSGWFYALGILVVILLLVLIFKK